MLGLLRNTMVWLGVPCACLGILFAVGYLQEFASDDIEAAAGNEGAGFPLEDPWIEIDLQRMTLELRDGEHMIKRYAIGYGSGRIGRVVGRRDSTPLGEFKIVEKRQRKDILVRGSRFLVFNFPNPDVAYTAYEADVITEDELDSILQADAEGAVPPMDTALGGPLGIQGNYWFFMGRRFTDGSVALANADVNELYEHVPVGTPVVIRAQ